ncbi:hypothetical protein M1146_04265 [Patescibacteria group bacterium]|nr:hypothetical protein [Patescibacteria group bacterium]
MAIEILKRLASLHVPLSTQFSLPMIQGGYFPVNINLPPKGVPLLEPIINLTEEQKLEFSIVYLGKFFKQGHRYKTWKERLFCLHDTKLLYYDLKMTYTGELSVDELFYQNIANPNEINAPKTSYCFQLVNMNTNNNEYMNCYVFNENIRSLFSMFIGLKNSYLMSFKVIINIPKVKSGWIKKQGHVIKNWKLRYFILNYGLLTYYEKEQPDGLFTQETQTSFQLTTSTSSKDNSHSGPGIGGVKSSIMSSLDTAKGQVELKNATVTVALNDEHNKPLNLAVDHRIQVLDRNGYKLFLAFDSSDEKKAWFEAIKKHIDYANEYLE